MKTNHSVRGKVRYSARPQARGGIRVRRGQNGFGQPLAQMADDAIDRGTFGDFIYAKFRIERHPLIMIYIAKN